MLSNCLVICYFAVIIAPSKKFKLNSEPHMETASIFDYMPLFKVLQILIIFDIRSSSVQSDSFYHLCYNRLRFVKEQI